MAPGLTEAGSQRARLFRGRRARPQERTSLTISRDTGPVTSRQPSTRPRWWRLLLAALAAVMGVLLSATAASATALTAAETRVGAITVTTPAVIGFDPAGN